MTGQELARRLLKRADYYSSCNPQFSDNRLNEELFREAVAALFRARAGAMGEALNALQKEFDANVNSNEAQGLAMAIDVLLALSQSPRPESASSLERLVAEITPENRHEEIGGHLESGWAGAQSKIISHLREELPKYADNSGFVISTTVVECKKLLAAFESGSAGAPRAMREVLESWSAFNTEPGLDVTVEGPDAERIWNQLCGRMESLRTALHSPRPKEE